MLEVPISCLTNLVGEIRLFQRHRILLLIESVQRTPDARVHCCSAINHFFDWCDVAPHHEVHSTKVEFWSSDPLPLRWTGLQHHWSQLTCDEASNFARPKESWDKHCLTCTQAHWQVSTYHQCYLPLVYCCGPGHPCSQTQCQTNEWQYGAWKISKQRPHVLLLQPSVGFRALFPRCLKLQLLSAKGYSGHKAEVVIVWQATATLPAQCDKLPLDEGGEVHLDGCDLLGYQHLPMSLCRSLGLHELKRCHPSPSQRGHQYRHVDRSPAWQFPNDRPIESCHRSLAIPGKVGHHNSESHQHDTHNS